jgi:hypothetical protein
LKVGIEGWKKLAGNFSPSEIGDVFACVSTTIDPMDKWRTQADLAHQIGIKTIPHTVLIAGCWCFTRWWRKFGRIFLPSDFGDVLANLATTSRAMDRWMLQLDSVDQKGPETTLEGILIVVERCFTTERSVLGLDQGPKHTANGSCLSTHIPRIAQCFSCWAA